MKAGEVSTTARRVAAYRHEFDRVAAPFGRPEDDDRLQIDVAAGIETTGSFMTSYLRSRTHFFDRMVVDWLKGGGTQVVAVGAGFDGRSLRYAKRGTRWFELDHPATQADKLTRLARLEIMAPNVTFVPSDFSVDDVARSLEGAGHNAAEASLFTCEGVAGYLDPAVFGDLLSALAGAAATGSRFGITIALEPTTAAAKERRQALAAAVGEVGEPLVNSVPLARLAATLAAAGWRVTSAIDPSGRSSVESDSSTAYVTAVPKGDSD